MLKKAVLKVFWKTKYNRRLISGLEERFQALVSDYEKRMEYNAVAQALEEKKEKSE